MRIIIDLDGTICPLKQEGETYDMLIPHPGAIERLNELKAAGHYLIIQTARNMATCDSNVGKVMKNIGGITLNWLEKFNVPYDEIFFGKPNGQVYIDDRALRFSDWESITEQLLINIAKEK